MPIIGFTGQSPFSSSSACFCLNASCLAYSISSSWQPPHRFSTGQILLLRLLPRPPYEPPLLESSLRLSALRASPFCFLETENPSAPLRTLGELPSLRFSPLRCLENAPSFPSNRFPLSPAPFLPSPSLTLCLLSFTLPLTLSFTPSLTLSLTLSFTPSFTLSLTLSFTPPFTLPLTLSLTPSLSPFTPFLLPIPESIPTLLTILPAILPDIPLSALLSIFLSPRIHP